MTITNSTHSDTDDTFRIYVACLAAYNNGKLHGKWIDALNNSPDEIMTEVQAMLKESPEPDAEEWAIHDYEGFENIRLTEWEGLEQVHELAEFLNKYGCLGSEVYSYYSNLNEAYLAMTERYFGCYESIADYAESFTAETSTIPENLAYYIDYEKMARDMEMSGDIITFETAYDEVHVFWSH